MNYKYRMNPDVNENELHPPQYYHSINNLNYEEIAKLIIKIGGVNKGGEKFWHIAHNLTNDEILGVIEVFNEKIQRLSYTSSDIRASYMNISYMNIIGALKDILKERENKSPLQNESPPAYSPQNQYPLQNESPRQNQPPPPPNSGGKSRRKHKKSRKSHHRLKRQRLRTRRRHTHRLRQRNR